MALGDSLREQIVAKALDLFYRKGYHETSLQEVIDAAGCSKGGFYHHFGSKEHLLYLVHDSFISYELQRGTEVATGPGSPAWKLHQIIIDLVESIALYQAQVTVFFEERRFLSSEQFHEINEKRDHYVAIVEGVVAQAIQCGELRSDLDLKVVTFAIFGMCNWTYQWMRPDGKMSPRQVGEIMSEIALQGLRAVPPAGG